MKKPLLSSLGTDSRRWAAEFCKAFRDRRKLDEDEVSNWFAQSIMAGRIEEAKAQGKPPK